MTRTWHAPLDDTAAPGPWINDPGRACAGTDTETFFPERSGGSPGEVARAKRLCARCPVQVECRDYAVNAMPRVWGVWGGTTEADRKRLRKTTGVAA